MRTSPTLLVCAALCLTACTRDPAPPKATPPVAPPASTETGPSKPAQMAAPSTAAKPKLGVTPPKDALDWDGASWDAGNVVGLSREGDKVILTFDRFGFFQDGTLREGISLTAEPLVYGNTDMPYENKNARVRRYLLAADAEVVKVANTHDLCADAMSDTPAFPKPRFEPVAIDALIEASKKGDVSAPGLEGQMQDALTFGADGRVKRVVFSGGC